MYIYSIFLENFLNTYIKDIRVYHEYYYPKVFLFHEAPSNNQIFLGCLKFQSHRRVDITPSLPRQKA